MLTTLVTSPHPYVPRRYVGIKKADTSDLCNAVIQFFRNAVEG